MAGYDDKAEWYDEAVREGPLAPFHDWIVPIMVGLVGEVEGHRVCDLACGQGVVARSLADRGARVLGVDISEKLLDIARLHERKETRGVEYAQEDAQTLNGLANGAFDGVVCNMALMDIPDLDATLAAVSRVLRPGGWFVFSVVHPICQTPGSPWWAWEGAVVGRAVRKEWHASSLRRAGRLTGKSARAASSASASGARRSGSGGWFGRRRWFGWMEGHSGSKGL